MDCGPLGSSVHEDSPGKNPGVDCHALLQGIVPTQSSNPGLLHCRPILYHLSHQGNLNLLLNFFNLSFQQWHKTVQWIYTAKVGQGNLFVPHTNNPEKAMATHTPVLLPGKSHGRRSLVGCSPWGREELDTTSNFTFTVHFPALEKEMATHSMVLAWRIPGTAEPGGLPSMGSHRVGHDWSDLAAAAYQ